MAEMEVLVRGLAHVGIRVHDLARSRAFYEKLGFKFAWGPAGPEPVAAMLHPSGLELNFILNAPSERANNILMDVPEKHTGITHIALKIAKLAEVEKLLVKQGIAISGKRGDVALFVRDPDRNVIELAAD
jgi:lactoylglutathione lyase